MHRQGKGQSALRVRLPHRHPRYQPKGRQFVLHAKALHDNPFDGHTLKPAVADIERNAGVDVKRIHVDKGYRGHNYPDRFRVFIFGQVRRTIAAIKREMETTRRD